MRRAIYVPPMETFGDVNVMVELAVSAEAAGWDGFFLWDHIRYERPVPFVDPWVTLAAIATRTSRLRIGALVTPLARRRPHKVAREIVTLDHLSGGGRVVLGVGLGIDFWGEYSAFDEPATDDVARARLLDEGIAAIQRYLDGELLPKPLGKIPIWAAAIVPFRQGPLGRAASLDGVMPWSTDANTTPAMMREARERIGRDDGYDYVVAGRAELADEYAAAGVTWLLESFWPEVPLELAREVVGRGP